MQSMLDLSDDINKIDFYHNALQMDDIDMIEYLPKMSDRPR